MNFKETLFLVLLLQFNINIAAKSQLSTFLQNDLVSNDLKTLLIDMLVKNLEPYKCVAIISDTVYSPLFQRNWFQTFQSLITFLMISVPDDEDLLSPSNDTQETLNLISISGCQLYLILLTNGLQTARFLQFADRYRAIDTRSKFVLIYDNRLFEKHMFYLWKRIINVIFIKEYSGISGDIKKVSKPWFELITVPFPTPITSILVPRRLDIWANGKFRKNQDLFREKTLDLKNQTLRVVTFSHIPGTKKVKTENLLDISSSRTGIEVDYNFSFIGAEVEILKTVSMAMNFHCEFYEPEDADIELWGRKSSSSKYTGLLGEMISSRADIALGDLYYIPSMLHLMDLTLPYNTECLTFLTPEALTDNSWKTLILPFSSFMWLAVLLCLVVSSVAFCCLSHFHNYVDKVQHQDRTEIEDKVHIKKKKIITLSMYPDVSKMDEDTKYAMMKDQYKPLIREGQSQGLYQFTDPVNSVLYTYSMLLLVSLPKLPTGWSLRIMTGWYWLYCLLVVVAYRSSLTAILARPVPIVTIDTLQELIESKLICGSWGEINTNFFKTAIDPTLQVIGESFETVSSSENAIDRVADGKFAFYENTYFLKESILKRQIRFQSQNDNDVFLNESSINIDVIKQDRGLHIMNDCVIKMPISIGLQKNSPIKPRFDKHIRKVVEAGLVKKWLDDVMQFVLKNEVQTNKEEVKALMNMRKFSGALVVLFAGYILSLSMLLIELGYFHYVEKRKPNFNKYSKTVSVIKKEK